PAAKPEATASGDTTAKASDQKPDEPDIVEPPKTASKSLVVKRQDPTSEPPTTKATRPKPPKVTVTELPVAAADPLASIFLTVELKSGRAVVKPMSDVLRFSTDRGVITIVGKDGSVAR